MRWPWRQREPMDPDHGRDELGRLHDGDRVRPAGWDGWGDVIPGYQALTEPTQILPTVDHPTLVDSGSTLLTPAQQFRGNGGGVR